MELELKSLFVQLYYSLAETAHPPPPRILFLFSKPLRQVLTDGFDIKISQSEDIK